MNKKNSGRETMEPNAEVSAKHGAPEPPNRCADTPEPKSPEPSKATRAPLPIGPLPVAGATHEWRGIDYDQLLEKLIKTGRIGKAKLAKYTEDPGTIEEDMDNAKTVLSLGWDGNSAGNSGGAWIVTWKGFFFCQSSDYDPEGPFDTLDDALGTEWFHTPSPNPTLYCKTIPQAQLLELGRDLVCEEGDEVLINHRGYALRGGQLVQVP